MQDESTEADDKKIDNVAYCKCVPEISGLKTNGTARAVDNKYLNLEFNQETIDFFHNSKENNKKELKSVDFLRLRNCLKHYNFFTMMKSKSMSIQPYDKLKHENKQIAE